MRSSIRRLVGMVLFFVVLCAMAMLLGRSNPPSNALSALGFGPCDGVPCYRGLRAGMDWSQIQGAGIKGTVSGNLLTALVDSSSNSWLNIFQSKDNHIAGIVVYPDDNASVPFITVSDVILEYGIPCGVLPIFADNNQSILAEMVLTYPTLEIFVAVDDGYVRTNTLRINSRILRIHMQKPENSCYGVWRGFASAMTYR